MGMLWELGLWWLLQQNCWAVLCDSLVLFVIKIINKEIAFGSSFRGDVGEMVNLSSAGARHCRDELVLGRQSMWGSWLISGKQSEIPPSPLLGDQSSHGDVPCGIPCWRKMAEIWDCGVLGTLLSTAAVV